MKLCITAIVGAANKKAVVDIDPELIRIETLLALGFATIDNLARHGNCIPVQRAGSGKIQGIDVKAFLAAWRSWSPTRRTIRLDSLAAHNHNVRDQEMLPRHVLDNVEVSGGRWSDITAE